MAGKDSHKTWFGWSTRKSSPKFYCYTLNSENGWITEKARRRATMTDLQDLVSARNFELLVSDFERREISETLDVHPLVEAFEKAHEEMVEEVSADSGDESSSSSELVSHNNNTLLDSSRFSLAFKTKRHEFIGDEI